MGASVALSFKFGLVVQCRLSRRRRARYQCANVLATNKVSPIYEFTTQLATLEPPPPELQRLLGAVHGDQSAMDDFVSVSADTFSPVAFFDPAISGPSCSNDRARPRSRDRLP